MAVVLVAEDDPHLRALIRLVLVRAGHSVFTAVDGIEALELLESVHPHLVVTDHEMPRMNGTELHRVMRQREDTAHIPIIVVSAYDSSPAVHTLARAVEGCIYKPFNPEALLHLVDRVLPPSDRASPSPASYRAR